MTQGVDIVVGDISVRVQNAVSGNYGNDSMASGIYKRIESYANDVTDVKHIAAFPVGAGKAAVIILHA